MAFLMSCQNTNDYVQVLSTSDKCNIGITIFHINFAIFFMTDIALLNVTMKDCNQQLGLQKERLSNTISSRGFCFCFQQFFYSHNLYQILTKIAFFQRMCYCTEQQTNHCKTALTVHKSIFSQFTLYFHCTREMKKHEHKRLELFPEYLYNIPW